MSRAFGRSVGQHILSLLPLPVGLLPNSHTPPPHNTAQISCAHILLYLTRPLCLYQITAEEIRPRLTCSLWMKSWHQKMRI
jgi:hypothetical protein